jgi:hypothetical protein
MSDMTFPAAEPGVFTVLPDGVYKMKVVGAKLDVAKSSGGQGIAARLRVLEGPNKGDEIPQMWMWQQDTLWRIKEDLRNSGVLTYEMVGENVPFTLNEEQALDLLSRIEGNALVFNEVYNGTQRSKLKRFISQREYEGIMGVSESAPAPAVKPIVKPAVVTPQVKPIAKPF